ncbi:hypothetical protein ALC62_12364, partial [Cyphomyrmex costatus]
FKAEWLKEFKWLKNLKPECKRGLAYCILCNKSLQGGYAHLIRHKNNEVHKTNEKGQQLTPSIKKTKFIYNKSNKLFMWNVVIINRRIVFAMRLIGVGFQGISNFCGFMDIGTGFSPNSYYDIIENISVSKSFEEEKIKNEKAGNVKNQANGNLDTFEDEIQPLLRKVYEDFTTDDLLERCLGTNTQNSNESYNSCVWHIVPKHTFVGRKVVEIAAYCTACTFNEDLQPLLKIMETMGVTIGRNAVDLVQRRNKNRITTSNRRSLEASKEHRSELRIQKAAQNEAYENEEGLIYGAGIAD